MQQHDVNVTERIEFAPAISTKGDQRDRNFGCAISTGSSGRSAEDVLQQNIDELSAPRANFAATPAGERAIAESKAAERTSFDGLEDMT